MAHIVDPGLGYDAASGEASAAPIRPETVRGIADAELVIVDNLLSLPLNPKAQLAVAAARRGRPTLVRHHDLPWQRPRFVAHEILDDDAWVHVTVSRLAQEQLADRGIKAHLMRNRFDVHETAGDRVATRRQLGVTGPLVVQPTRALARKNVGAGLALAQDLGAEFWLTGAAEDSYARQLDAELAASTVPVHRGDLGRPMRDVYAAADVVVLPSSWEGFGNPAVEGSIHRRPVAVGLYPVAAELRELGFNWFDTQDRDGLAEMLRDPDPAMLDHNWTVAAEHLALTDLPPELDSVLALLPLP